MQISVVIVQLFVYGYEEAPPKDNAVQFLFFIKTHKHFNLVRLRCCIAILGYFYILFTVSWGAF